MKGVFKLNIPIFPPNSGEGLHFSAFHYFYEEYTVCQGKGKFGKLGGGSHAVLFMVSLGPPSARPMAQALQQQFEYYYYEECMA